MRRLALITGLLLVLVSGLAGCGGGTDEAPLNLQLIQTGRAILVARFGPGKQPPVVTRAVLDRLEGSFMEAVLERNGQRAYLYVSARRRDDHPGEIVVWRTEDNITLALRAGVLIATRGLGGDLISSEVPIRDLGPDSGPGPAGSGLRHQHIRARDNKAVSLALACELSDLGPETIEIVGARHATRHLVERCTGGGGKVVNEYWVDSRANLVWQSRQWAGPEIGYVHLRRLTTG